MLFSNIKIFNKTLVVILLLVFLSIALRFLYFPNNIYFGYDQARDAFVSSKIISSGDLKIQGPTSSGPGIYHGPLLYYILGPLYTISDGDPAKVLIFFILLNALSAPLIYLLTKSLTGSTKTGLISALLFTFSYEQTQWAIFQSNTSLASFGILTFLTGLSLAWFSKRQYGLIISAVGLGIAFQSEIYLIYLLPVASMLWYSYFKEKTNLDIKVLRLSTIIFFAFSLTYILSELIFKFPTINAIISLLGRVEGNDSTTFLLTSFLDRLGLATSYSVFGFGSFPAFIFLLGMLIGLWKIKSDQKIKVFLFTWLFSSVILTIFGKGFANIYHFSIGISLVIILITSITLTYWIKNTGLLVLVLLILILGQIKLIINHNPNGATLTLVQKGMLLSNEKQIVDYIYQSTTDKSVSVAALSNPYNVNTVWAYVFKHYWKNDKPFPYWQRDFAKGFAGENVFTPSPAQEPCVQFLIKENILGLDSSVADQFMLEQSFKSKVIEEKQFGQIKVEKRKHLDCK